MPIFSLVVGFIGCLLAAAFGAMMTVPASTALANLKSYSLALGITPRTGLSLGLATIAAAVILFIVGRRNRRSPRSGIVEARRIVGSVIEDNYSERSDVAAGADELRNSVVRRNILKK